MNEKQDPHRNLLQKSWTSSNLNLMEQQIKEFNLSNELLTAIKGLRLIEPTQVQVLAIPHVMNGRDVIAESATGSGKTLAFGCGIVDSVQPGHGLQALILT